MAEELDRVMVEVDEPVAHLLGYPFQSFQLVRVDGDVAYEHLVLVLVAGEVVHYALGPGKMDAGLGITGFYEACRAYPVGVSVGKDGHHAVSLHANLFIGIRHLSNVSEWITRNIEQQISLLKRHAEVLDTLSKSEKPLGIIKLSKMTGHSPHLVRYSLRELENADAIVVSPRGAVLNSQSKSFLSNLNREVSGIQDNLSLFSDKLKDLSFRKK
jgi:predicted transcriptional regulator